MYPQTRIQYIYFNRDVWSCGGVGLTVDRLEDGYITVQYSTVQYGTVQYSTVRYGTVQYSTVQCSTVQCSALQYNKQ